MIKDDSDKNDIGNRNKANEELDTCKKEIY